MDDDTRAGHVWTPGSRHSTSEGVVRYESCVCGAWRVLLDARPVAASPWP